MDVGLNKVYSYIVISNLKKKSIENTTAFAFHANVTYNRKCSHMHIDDGKMEVQSDC